jgi:hypothetical protein
MWQLVYPLSSFLAVFIIESFLEALDEGGVSDLAGARSASSIH